MPNAQLQTGLKVYLRHMDEGAYLDWDIAENAHIEGRVADELGKRKRKECDKKRKR